MQKAQEEVTHPFCGAIPHTPTSLRQSLKHQISSHYMDVSQIDIKYLNCPMYSRCDYDFIRKMYSPSSSSAVTYSIELEFITVQNADFSDQFESLIQNQILPSLNSQFAPTKIQFTSRVIIVDLTNVISAPVQSFTIGMNSDSACSTSNSIPCFKDEFIIDRAVITPERMNRNIPGTLQIIIGPLLTSGLRGYANFPWYANKGMVVVHVNDLKSNFSTLPHEIGHALGLYHTFHGTAEVTCTSSCYELHADEYKGDLMSDTAPTPLHYLCTIPDVVTYPDQCTARVNWNGVDWSNFMGYSTNSLCRVKFSPQQIERLRCYAEQLIQDIPLDPFIPPMPAKTSSSRPYYSPAMSANYSHPKQVSTQHSSLTIPTKSSPQPKSSIGIGKDGVSISSTLYFSIVSVIIVCIINVF